MNEDGEKRIHVAAGQTRIWRFLLPFQLPPCSQTTPKAFFPIGKKLLGFWVPDNGSSPKFALFSFCSYLVQLP